MKKHRFLICALIALAFVAGFTALGTFQHSIEIVRAVANEDQAGAASFQHLGDWANKPTTWDLPVTGNESEANAVQFFLAGQGGDGRTFNAVLHAWKETNSMAVKVCDVAVVLGQQRVNIYPDGNTALGSTTWADTYTITDYWPKTVLAGTNASDTANGIWFDTMGFKHFRWDVYNGSGTGSEAGNISVWGTYF